MRGPTQGVHVFYPQHLYWRVLDDADQKVCRYCATRKATTLDHCPSPLMVDAVEPDFFAQRSIPLLPIPACMPCNNNMGTTHAWHEGRIVHLDWR
jgi:hypothetical protein